MNSNTSNEFINSRDIHKHAFWLYSVIIGLSVEEALRHVLPHIGELNSVRALHIGLDGLQLALFLCLVVRFFLGSVRYFDEAHIGESALQYKTKNYALDFFFGLIHFSGFLGLSLSIGHSKDWVFLFWLTYILLYDLIWILGCRKYETIQIVYVWTVVNVVTFLISLALSLIVWVLASSVFNYYVTHPDRVWFTVSIIFMIPIFFFSFIDIYSIFKADTVFERWFSKFSARKTGNQEKVSPPPPNS